jgi:hypothetical protein
MIPNAPSLVCILEKFNWGEQLILRDEFMEMKHTTGRWSGVQEFIQQKFGMKLPYLIAKQQNLFETIVFSDVSFSSTQ